MEDIKKVIDELNKLELIQKDFDLDENLPEDVYKKYFEDKKPIEEGLDVDKHRWYETSVQVFQFGDSFLGVRSITDLKGESSCVEDCFVTIDFFEMEEVKTITYKKIQ